MEFTRWRMTHLTHLPPSAACMRQWIGSALAEIMACRLFGAKPLSKPMLACQLDSREHISVIYESEFYHFHSRKFNLKCRLPKWRPFLPGGDKLTQEGEIVRYIHHWSVCLHRPWQVSSTNSPVHCEKVGIWMQCGVAIMRSVSCKILKNDIP